MSSRKSSVQSIMASAIALSMMSASASALAAKGDMEKCYGIVKAGKNDCKTSTNSGSMSFRVESNTVTGASPARTGWPAGA